MFKESKIFNLPRSNVHKRSQSVDKTISQTSDTISWEKTDKLRPSQKKEKEKENKKGRKRFGFSKNREVWISQHFQKSNKDNISHWIKPPRGALGG